MQTENQNLENQNVETNVTKVETKKEKKVSTKKKSEKSTDEKTLQNLLNKVSEVNLKSSQSKEDKMYKDEKIPLHERKNFRSATRKKFYFLLLILISAIKKNEIEKIKERMKTFFDFYKERYRKNDLTCESCCGNNANEETKEAIKLHLQILKLYLSKAKK